MHVWKLNTIENVFKQILARPIYFMDRWMELLECIKVEDANQNDMGKDIVGVTTTAGSAYAIDWSLCVVCHKLSHNKEQAFTNS